MEKIVIAEKLLQCTSVYVMDLYMNVLYIGKNPFIRIITLLCWLIPFSVHL